MSDPVELSDIEAARAEDGAIRSEQEASREKVSELNARLYEQVMAGQSTGDRLIDHVVRRNHGHHPDAVELFRSLEERVAAHVGEPVLVVSRGTEYQRHVFGQGWQDSYVVERISMGVLNAPELNLEEHGGWSFPTDSHVVRDNDGLLSHAKHKVEDGPLTTAAPGRGGFARKSPLEGALDEPIQVPDALFPVTYPGDQKRLEIAIGADEVAALVKETPLLREEDCEEMLDLLLQLPVPEGKD